MTQSKRGRTSLFAVTLIIIVLLISSIGFNVSQYSSSSIISVEPQTRDSSSSFVGSDNYSSYTVEFLALGLSSGQTWEIQLGAFYGSSSSPCMKFTITPGNYQYFIYLASTYGFIDSGTISVTGNEVIDIHFYHVDFTLLNYTAEYPWKVSICNNVDFKQMAISNNSSLSLTLVSGTYKYGIDLDDLGYNLTLVTNNNFVVRSNITVNYSLNYAEFSVKGFPADKKGYSWGIELSHISGLGYYVQILQIKTTHSSALILFPTKENLSYCFFINTPSGTFSIENGSIPFSSNVIYPVFAFYAEKFVTVGLKPNEEWSVSIFNNTREVYDVKTCTNISFAYLMNGTYIEKQEVYSPNNAGSPSFVNKTSLVLKVSGDQGTFIINLNSVNELSVYEYNLPFGTYWDSRLTAENFSITIGGHGNIILFFVGRGNYSLFTNAGTAFLPAGNVSVSNSYQNTSVSFYSVTFNETGLIHSYSVEWKILLYSANGTNIYTHCRFGSSPTNTLYVLNGSYSFNLQTTVLYYSYSFNDKYYSCEVPSNNVSVFGKDVVISINFYLKPGYYDAVLHFIYLAAGSFSIFLQFPFGSGRISGLTGNITFEYVLTNGTYSYCIFINSPSHRTISSSFSVKGSDVCKTFNLTIFAYSSVTFSENGLPEGMYWSVTLCGTTHTSNLSFINFAVDTTPLYYKIIAPPGYYADPSSGQLTVDGSNTTVNTYFFNGSMAKYAYVKSTTLLCGNNQISGNFLPQIKFLFHRFILSTFCMLMFYASSLVSYDHPASLLFFDDPLMNTPILYNLTSRCELELKPFNNAHSSLSCCPSMPVVLYNPENSNVIFTQLNRLYSYNISAGLFNKPLQFMNNRSYITRGLFDSALNRIFLYAPISSNLIELNSNGSLIGTYNIAPKENHSYIISNPLLLNPINGNIIIGTDNSNISCFDPISQSVVSEFSTNFSVTNLAYDTQCNEMIVAGDTFSKSHLPSTFPTENVSSDIAIYNQEHHLLRQISLPGNIESTLYDPETGFIYATVAPVSSPFQFFFSIYRPGYLLVINPFTLNIIQKIELGFTPIASALMDNGNEIVVYNAMSNTLSDISVGGHPSFTLLNRSSFLLILISIAASSSMIAAVPMVIYRRRKLSRLK